MTSQSIYDTQKGAIIEESMIGLCLAKKDRYTTGGNLTCLIYIHD